MRNISHPRPRQDQFASPSSALELHLASQLRAAAPIASGTISSWLPSQTSLRSRHRGVRASDGKLAERPKGGDLCAEDEFLLAAAASVLAQAAKAEEPKVDAELDLGPVEGTEELWYLLTALDTLIFGLAVAVIKDQGVIVQARREVQPYTSQLSDPKAEEAFNAALKSSEGQARIEQNKTAITDAAKEIDALLTDVVSPPIRASIVHAFARSSNSARRPRGREPIVVVPRLCVPKGAMLTD